MRRPILVIAVVLALAGAGVGYGLAGHGPSKQAAKGSSSPALTTSRRSAPTKARPRQAELGPLAAWPMYGYDLARTHVAPVSFRLRPPYRELWARGVDDWVEFPPSVAYGNVYIGQLNGVVHAYSGRTGLPVWSRSFEPDCTFATPTIANGVLYETFLPPPCDHGDRSKPGMTVAMDARSGRLLWRWLGPASESAPLVHDGTLYEGSWHHYLYALDIRRRRPRVRWRFTADAEINASPAYADGTIYIATDAGSVYAVDARNGRERWHASGYSNQYFYATPTVAYGRVFIGNTDGTVYAFRASNGRLLWSANAGTYVYTAAAVWNGTVYVGSYDGNVYAFNAFSGRMRWKQNLGGSIHGAPTIMDGLIYFSTCGTCGEHGSRYAELGPRRTYALDTRGGRIVWRFSDGHYSPLAADGQRVYLMGDNVLYGLVPCSSPERSHSSRSNHRCH